MRFIQLLYTSSPCFMHFFFSILKLKVVIDYNLYMLSVKYVAYRPMYFVINYHKFMKFVEFNKLPVYMHSFYRLVKEQLIF